MSQSTEQTPTETNLYPATLRARPEYFVGATGRHGVYYLVDHLLRSLVWGTKRDALGSISITVETDGTFRLKRTWPGEADLFPGIEGPMVQSADESIMARHFQRCVGAIGQGAMSRLEWSRANPSTSIYLPVAVALSARASVCLTDRSGSFSQTYRHGSAQEPVARGAGGEACLEVELQLDTQLLEEDIPAYPFRIRLPELVALLPGLSIDLQYKGFKQVHYSSSGMDQLLEFYVPEEDRFHADPFTFQFADGDLRYNCCLFLIKSEMERLKSFGSLDESYHGGVHERVLRRTVREVLRRLHKLEPPVRRQSCENIASSRMTYFGKFGATIPYRRDARRTEYVRTVPGLAATLQVDSPSLEWETNHRARIVKPEMQKVIRPELLVAFRRWVLDHPDAIGQWKSQWAPKAKRARKTRTTQATSEKNTGKEE